MRAIGGEGTALPELVTAPAVEAQCVAVSPLQELWVGTRTGIYRVPVRAK
jgi:hypothetical protein